MTIVKTLFEKWHTNEPGYTNLGSFQTRILSAYQIADEPNRKRLQAAFPHWFCKIEVVNADNPNLCFDQALKEGRMSDNETLPTFIGNYMYMGTEVNHSTGERRDQFKHRDTRQYLS